MLDNYYDSYGYKMPEHFVTTAEIKKVKFAPANHIEQNLTEIGSFFSETGQETGALSQSPLFYKKGEKKNNGGGGDNDEYKKMYLTFEYLGGGRKDSVGFLFAPNVSTSTYAWLAYSIDDGETWTTMYNENGHSVGKSINFPHEVGQKILFKGSGVSLYENGQSCYFTSDGHYNVYGNIMSLLYADDFADKTSFEEGTSGNFYGLFSMLGKLTGGLMSARYLRLPATTLAVGCYYEMFAGCASLTAAPELPATTLADNCYYEMFAGCVSLTTAPELPATTLAEECYAYMFTECTSLTKAPELPATTLADNCYTNMFEGCASLTTAPELPAITLTEHCYEMMFYGCTSLNYIKCLATDISARRCTDEWVNSVSNSGTFVKDASISSWTTGSSGIPEGWTVEEV